MFAQAIIFLPAIWLRQPVMRRHKSSLLPINPMLRQKKQDLNSAPAK